MQWALTRCRSVYAYLETRLRGVLTSPRGQAGVITAILAPVIISAAGLAIDAALWQVNQRSLQGAADQAAIAGINAYILAGNADGVATDPVAQTAALAVAKSFGYDACTTCPCTNGACAGLPLTPTSATCISNPTNCLRVTISEPQTRYLSQLLYSDQPVASAGATTTFAPGGACVLALDQKIGGSMPAQPPSVSLSGSTSMTLDACNLVNNLNADGATKDESSFTGTSLLNATDGGQVLLSQVDQYFGSGRVTPVPVYGSSPMPDPYAHRTPPSTSGGCTYPGPNGVTPNAFDNTSPVTSSTTLTPTALQPTVLQNQTISGTPYSGTPYTLAFKPASPTTPLVFCGGLNINTGSVYLYPGIYIMDGGGFTANGNVTIYGDQVTIYITCDTYYLNLTRNPITGHNINTSCSGSNYGSVNISGNGGSFPKVTLTPPPMANGEIAPTGTEGISVWIDKNAPVSGTSGCGGSCGTASFTGDAGLNINGAIYAPTQAVSYEGGTATLASTMCNQLVSLTVTLSGGHTTEFSQQGCTNNSGVASAHTAQLVE